MKQVDQFLLECEEFKTFSSQDEYEKELKKYIMYDRNMTIPEAAEIVEKHRSMIPEAFASSIPIADVAAEMVDGVPTEEEARAFFGFSDDDDEEDDADEDADEDPETLALIDDLFRHLDEQRNAGRPKCLTSPGFYARQEKTPRM